MLKPQQTFGFVLQDVARLMRRDFNRRVQDLGLTQAQWQILLRLKVLEGIRQSKLAEMMEMQPISVTRLIDRMESSGWVERRPDPQDRRAVNLYLTDKVEPIIEKMKARGAETRRLAFTGISPEDQDRLFELMQTMRANFVCEEGKQNE